MLRLRPSFHRNAILLGSVVASLSTSPSAAVGQSQLPLCPFDTKVIWTQCQGTTVDDGEEKYVGEFKDDRRNGHGTLTVANGKKYVGEFRDGALNGQGVLYKPDGTIEYGGKWNNNKFVPAFNLNVGDPATIVYNVLQRDIVSETISASERAGDVNNYFTPQLLYTWKHCAMSARNFDTDVFTGSQDPSASYIANIETSKLLKNSAIVTVTTVFNVMSTRMNKLRYLMMYIDAADMWKINDITYIDDMKSQSLSKMCRK
jgi:hypothetical protein